MRQPVPAADLDRLDYYALLGVEREATADAIKRAFHDFARRYHPDRFLADAEAHRQMLARYRRGTEAYRVLSDPASRRLYAHCLEQGLVRYDPSVARQSQRPTQRPTGTSMRVDLPRPAAVPREHPPEEASEPVLTRKAPPERKSAHAPKPAADRGGTVRAQRGPSSVPSRRGSSASSDAAAGTRSLADMTSGRAREFAHRAQRALDAREYRSARLSLRLALNHDAGNELLQAELKRLEKILGGP